MLNKEWIKRRFRQYGGYLVLGMLAILLEFFLFHAREFFSAAEKEVVFDIAGLSVENAELYENGEMVLCGDEGSGQLYLTDLQKYLKGQRLRNVRLELSLLQAADDGSRVSGVCKMQVYIRDAGHDRYAVLGEHVYREDVEDSHYLWLDAMDPVKTVVLDLKLSEGNVLRIDRIVLNAYKPVHFSILRCFGLFILMALLYALRNGSALWNHRIGDAPKKEMLLAAGAGILLIVPAVLINAGIPQSTAEVGFRPYQELAEALSVGQVSLLQEPAEKLMALENPYDYTARTAAGLVEGVDYPWDTVYFKGHYYTYFGVVPCVLIYLPYYALLGKHVQDTDVILGLAVFLYAGSYLLAGKWLLRLRREVRCGDAVLAAVSVFLGSGIAVCLGGPDAHDVPRIMGLVLTVWGLYFWLCAAPDTEDGGIKKGRLAAGSILMALAVGCRPNMLLYSLMAVPFFFDRFRTEVKRKKSGSTLAAFALPYLPVAVALMYYNAIRFGSITDFGYAYNLTVLDYTQKNLFLDRIWVGICEFFLRFPRLEYVFPYIKQGSFAQLDPLGHGTFYYTYGYGGLLICAPIVWCIPAVFGKNKRRKEAACLILAAMLNALINMGLAGVAYHYMMDFAAFLLLAGWMGAMLVRERVENTEGERIFERFMRGAFVVSALFYICFYFSSLQAGNTALFYRIYYAMGI